MNIMKSSQCARHGELRQHGESSFNVFHWLCTEQHYGGCKEEEIIVPDLKELTSQLKIQDLNTHKFK